MSVRAVSINDIYFYSEKKSPSMGWGGWPLPWFGSTSLTFLLSTCSFYLLSHNVYGIVKYKVKRGSVVQWLNSAQVFLMRASSFSGHLGSLPSFSGCALAAGASRGVFRVSRSGFPRFVFVFPSASSASRFTVVMSGSAWSNAVSCVSARGCVVVVTPWLGMCQSASVPVL